MLRTADTDTLDQQWEVAKLLHETSGKLHARCRTPANILLARAAGAHPNVLDPVAADTTAVAEPFAPAAGKDKKETATKSNVAAGGKKVHSFLPTTLTDHEKE